MSLFFCRSVHLTVNIVFIAFIVVMVLRLLLLLLLLLLTILIIGITAHRRLMPRWSVVRVLWVEMLQRLPDAGHIRISENLGSRRL